MRPQRLYRNRAPPTLIIRVSLSVLPHSNCIECIGVNSLAPLTVPDSIEVRAAELTNTTLGYIWSPDDVRKVSSSSSVAVLLEGVKSPHHRHALAMCSPICLIHARGRATGNGAQEKTASSGWLVRTPLSSVPFLAGHLPPRPRYTPRRYYHYYFLLLLLLNQMLPPPSSQLLLSGRPFSFRHLDATDVYPTTGRSSAGAFK